jgi:flagellar biosynthesis/type III secretory pathway protein FliH
METIATDPRWRARHGILKVGALTVTTDANAIAKHIVQDARDQADAILHDAKALAQELALQAEADAVKRAAGLLEALKLANSTFLDRAEDIIVDLAQQLFDHLVMKTTPRKQIETSLRRLRCEAPPRLVAAVLRVHPDDIPLLPEMEWEVKRDSSIVRGVCLLEAANGEWHADFGAAVEAVRAAFIDAVRNRDAGQGDAPSASNEGACS